MKTEKDIRKELQTINDYIKKLTHSSQWQVKERYENYRYTIEWVLEK